MLMVNQLVGFGVLSGGVTFTQTHNADIETDATSPSFSSVAIGANGGLVVAAVIGRDFNVGTRTLNSATIDGGAATLNVASSAGFACGGIFSRVVTGASTTTIVPTFSGTMEGCSLVVWVLEGYSSATPFDALAAAPAVSPVSVALDVPSDGVVLAMSGHFNTNDTTFVGVTKLTEADVANPTGSYASGSYQGPAETNRTIQASWTGGNSGTVVAASWA